ncbi:MAG TPA: AzlC family ABC transporter permease, partial [Micromonosporaceae bacterium]
MLNDTEGSDGEVRSVRGARGHEAPLTRSEPRFPARGTPERTAVMRVALGIGATTGAYGLSFGAIGVASGLSVFQTCALSLLMFSGGSQFALVGILGSGGGVFASAGTAALLGSRNAFYGLRLAGLLRVRRGARLGAAQLVIDESTA